MAYEKNRRRPPQEDDGTLIEGRNAVIEALRAGTAIDKRARISQTSPLRRKSTAYRP